MRRSVPDGRDATINDYDVKVAKVGGEFVRQVHAETDELVLVTAGRLVIRTGDAGTAAGQAGSSGTAAITS